MKAFLVINVKHDWRALVGIARVSIHSEIMSGIAYVIRVSEQTIR